MLSIEPVTLRGEGICLEPLSQDHAQGLYNRGRYAPDWAYICLLYTSDAADE